MGAVQSRAAHIHDHWRSEGAHTEVLPLGYTAPESYQKDEFPTMSCRLHRPATFVAFILLGVMARILLDPEPLMPQIKYSITAFIERIPSKRLWSAESFSAWHRVEVVEQVPITGIQLVHVHHMCVKGGENGLALPHLRSYEEQDSLKTYQPGSHKPAAFRMMDQQEMATTIFPRESNASGATQIHGPTFFINCWNRAPDDTNPSHWLTRLNKLYEIAEVMRSSVEGKASALPLFEHLAFHQCPSYNSMIKSGAWPLGALMMDAATRHWTDAGLWKGPETDVIELNRNDRNWTCFEDLYFETGHNSWYPAPQYQSSWLRTRHGIAEASSPSPSIPALALTQGTPPPMVSLEERCRAKKLRIHLFQRSTGSTLRNFANLEPVRALLQNYTSVLVPVVTVNATTPLAEQIETFRAFDVLVTSHGSQLGNITCSDPGTTAILEILPVVRDLCFMKNAVDANFTSYVVSTGHTPVAIPDHPIAICEEGLKTMDEHCEFNPKSDLWKCPEGWGSRLTACDTLVDLTILTTFEEGHFGPLRTQLIDIVVIRRRRGPREERTTQKESHLAVGMLVTGVDAFRPKMMSRSSSLRAAAIVGGKSASV